MTVKCKIQILKETQTETVIFNFFFVIQDSPDELHQAIFDRLDLFDGKGTKEMLEDLYEAPAGTFGIITESGTADHILGKQWAYALRKGFFIFCSEYSISSNC